MNINTGKFFFVSWCISRMFNVAIFFFIETVLDNVVTLLSFSKNYTKLNFLEYLFSYLIHD